MARLVVCALCMTVAQGLDSVLPLKPRWSASISGVNDYSNVSGTFQWDSGLGAGRIKVAASWTFKSFWAQQGLDDSMSITCNFEPGADLCTFVFRKNCHHELEPSRGGTLVQLLYELIANGTHNGDCFADRNVVGSQMWTAKLAGIGNITMCIAPDGLPSALTSEPNESWVGPANVKPATYNFSFHDVSLRPEVMAAPKCPKCEAAAPCPGRGVETMTLMRLTWGGEPWEQIWGLDVADLQGEVVFDPEFVHTYLKVFNVTLNSSFGPYRDCNYVKGQNTCSPPRAPSLAKLVSRMAAEDFSDGGCFPGQCSKNKEVGSWYTFPKEGGCVKGTAIGTDSCTWQLNSVKVVSTDCLKSAKVLAEAAQERKHGHLPWLKLEALVWERIAACPDIRSLRR
eukprot:TRINITY_DN3677_c0_g1_i4.p1 TRINITY_DN3677_c0_g1~~TRINITY_DN3677_c0_g1_i4.p1  ORF type:complete len:416 (+),score=60.07 TRINITY_DN3677_c0_g1_i4:58-1248(+)